MWAILSDIHGNFEAFRAVLDDVLQYRTEKTFILGDMLGYGPQPMACLDMAREVGSVTLLGNVDAAAWPLNVEDWGNTSAARTLEWACQFLSEPGTAGEARRQFLESLPREHREGDTLFVHGSPRNPLNEYVFPEDVYNIRKMTRIVELVTRYCFHGHTHIPGVITEDDPGVRYEHHSPEGEDWTFRLDHRKALIDVGSVGQPRDGDPRACYVLFDANAVRFRRVAYDIEQTVKQMLAIPEFEPFLAERLREGR